MGNDSVWPFDLKVAGYIDIALFRASRIGNKGENEHVLTDSHRAGFSKCWNGLVGGIPLRFPVLVRSYEQPAAHSVDGFLGTCVRHGLAVAVLPEKCLSKRRYGGSKKK